MISSIVAKHFANNTNKTRALFQQLRQGFKGFDQKRWHKSDEVFPETNFRYGYDKPQKHKTKSDREWYEAPIANRTRKRFQTIDYRKYTADLEEAAQRTLEGKTLEEEEEQIIVEKDEIFGEKGAPKRIYDRVRAKELYFHHRSAKNYIQNADRKIAFLTHFKPAFEKVPELSSTLTEIQTLANSAALGSPLSRAGIDQEFIIEDDFYLENTQCQELFAQIKEKIPNLHFSQLPELALVLSFNLRYNKDVFGVWKVIEESFMKSIHHYPVMELVKMRYASCSLSPKSLSRPTLLALQNIVFTELHNIPSLLDLSHTLFAFRQTNSLLQYTQILDEICKRPVKTLQEAIALLFVFSHSQFPNFKRKEIREKDQDKKEKFRILDHLADVLAENAKDIQGDDMVRVLVGLNNLQAENFKDVLSVMERYVIKNIDTLDAFQTASAIYGFSKAVNNTGFGSPALYKALQKGVEKHWSAFSNIEKAHAFYAFTSQDALDPSQRKKLIQPWLNENLEKNLVHSELHYVAFSLLYEQCKDAELWKKFVRNVSTSPYVVPVTNYFPLKLARSYLEGIFPTWKFHLYKLACQEAESGWNVSRQQTAMMTNKEWNAIGNIVQNRLNFNTIGYDNFENLLLIDWSIMPQRVALMIQGERQTLASTGKATPLHQLKLKLLENKKYGVVNLVYKDFENVPADQKVAHLKKLIEDAIAKQETYIKDIEEPHQWLNFMDKLEELTSRHVMLGEASKGGVVDEEYQTVNFDWSKLQKELKERQEA